MTRKIGIIGAGIVGATTAFYLSNEKVNLTIFDDGIGQATSASAGIISPWLSQRRNKEWYFLARQGAKFYDTLIKDLNLHLDTHSFYQKTGTLLFKKKPELIQKLYQLAIERKIEAPEIGDISILTPHDAKSLIPNLLSETNMLHITGGAKIDGAKLVHSLLEVVKKRNHTVKKSKIKKIAFSNQKWLLTDSSGNYECDELILTCGAWLNDLLIPLGFNVDVRPQKGQLIEIQTDFISKDWPVVIPIGEFDVIPFDKGKLVIGATHENDQGFNLDASFEQLEALKKGASSYINYLDSFSISNYRVGTRAYTSDFSPFFGQVDSLPKLLVASGLGSSGLTTGPIIGKSLADWTLKKQTLFEDYRFKPNQYIYLTT